MEQERIDKQLEWLDEQRRNDADKITSLTDKLSVVEDLLNKQDRQIKELSSEVARLTSISHQLHQYDDAHSKQREEFAIQLKQIESSHKEREKHIEQLHQIDQEEFSKNISEIRTELMVIETVQQSLESRQREEIRLSRELDKQEKRIDVLNEKEEEVSRTLHTIDESRKLDSRRIADLQTESTDLRIKIDTLRGEHDAIEDRVRRNEARITEAVSSEVNREEAQTIWLEKQEIRWLKFEKDWKNMEDQYTEFQQKAEEVDERMLQYDENYRAMQQTRTELDKLMEKLERRISEISEMHRIAEDRMRQEWTSFQADDQKRWNTYKLSNDEQWREHNRNHEKLLQEVQALRENVDESLRILAKMTEQSQRRVLELFAAVKEWAAEVESKTKEIR
ncbi:MAG: hypothetical protein GTO18_01510 [Anaerolineales bacterium]|nr:hypothetical protein [Anaerolineales bacterium]